MNITQSFTAERDRILLGGDHAAYHAQTTRRIHALRKRLGIATPRGRKYSPKAPVTAENVSQNIQWVQLLLASSERAWADAMTMKTIQSPENTQRPMAGSTKKQIVSRHRRAIAYATNLVEVLQESVSKSSPIDVLEAKAYLALLKGGLDFEKSRWSSCLHHFSVAKLIYSALDTTSKADTFKDLLSSTVDPSIRYAAYQLKLPRTKALADIAIEEFPSSENDLRLGIEKVYPEAFVTTAEKASSARSDEPTNMPTVISWRSRKVKIEDASISQALQNAIDKETALVKTFAEFRKGDVGSKDLAAAYEEVIDSRQEAVDTTKTAIDELRSEGVDQSDTRVQSLQITRTAVNFAVIEWRIGRNRILCGIDDGLTFDTTLSKNHSKGRADGKSQNVKEESLGRQLATLRERTALYESILQSLDAIKEFPGVAADSELVSEVEGKKAYFKALKCLAIGRSHSVHSDLSNALALFSRAVEYVEHAKSSLNLVAGDADAPTKLDINPSQLSATEKYLTSLALQYHGLVVLKRLGGSQTTKDKTFTAPLIERFHLNQYDDSADLSNLVNYPPKLQPIPVKPLFFDLAWNYIRYPGQPEVKNQTITETTNETKKEEKPAKKGWFGFGGR